MTQLLWSMTDQWRSHYFSHLCVGHCLVMMAGTFLFLCGLTFNPSVKTTNTSWSVIVCLTRVLPRCKRCVQTSLGGPETEALFPPPLLCSEPSAGVGRGDRGRRGVRGHSAPGARSWVPQPLWDQSTLLWFRPVPDLQGAAPEGRHSGPAGESPPQLSEPGAGLQRDLSLHIQNLYQHSKAHRAALSEVRPEQVLLLFTLYHFYRKYWIVSDEGLNEATAWNPNINFLFKVFPKVGLWSPLWVMKRHITVLRWFTDINLNVNKTGVVVRVHHHICTHTSALPGALNGSPMLRGLWLVMVCGWIRKDFWH